MKATNAIPEEEVFKDPALMQLFVNKMYHDVPGFNNDLYDNISDESRNYWGGAARNVVQGQWFADNNPMEYWAYNEVRQTNMFLSKVDQSPANGEQKAALKGQVKFLRAMLYFNMIKRYGGVPIITEPQELTDDLFVERQTVGEGFAFIIKELEEAIELLPNTYGSRDLDVGKANKSSATAFLGRVLLFWASPLYNQSGDNTRWEKAATINKKVIDGGVYQLHNIYSSRSTTVAPAPRSFLFPLLRTKSWEDFYQTPLNTTKTWSSIPKVCRKLPKS